MNIYFPLTSTGDTDDYILKLNGNDINMPVADYISLDTVNRGILNGGAEDYPDLGIDGNENDVMELTQSGVVVASLIGGGHPIRRPR